VVTSPECESYVTVVGSKIPAAFTTHQHLDLLPDDGPRPDQAGAAATGSPLAEIVGQFLSYAIPGIPYGCTFAIVAVGLVLTTRRPASSTSPSAHRLCLGYVYALLTEHG